MLNKYPHFHKFVNKLAAEKVRMVHGKKECEKNHCECGGVELISAAIDNILSAVDTFNKESNSDKRV